MFSIMNVLRTLLAKLIAFLYVVTTVAGAGLPFGASKLPETPDDFTPVIRFAVCSDVHLDGNPESAEAERLAKLFDTVYAYSETQEYKNFDALCVVGDFTDQGKAEQYDLFNSIIAENKKDETQLLVCMGNHEFIDTRDVDASQGTRMFEAKMERDDDTSMVINGYHFILASYCEDGHSFTGKCSWINSEIKKAIKDTGDKPVFVFQHPAPFASIYGSISWGDPSIPAVFLKYPQVVNFSGHSHFPVNDPRSCWQGGYTAFGCGTLSYFETELDGISGNFPYSVEEAAQFYIVEADAEGNVRVLSYDLITDQFFDNEYYLTGLAKRNFDYAYAKMKLRDDAPVFPESTQISVDTNDEGNSILTFTGAEDNYVVESYKLSVTKNGIKVAEDNFSGKYMYLFEEDVYSSDLGKLEPGKYNVQIVALNAYAETSAPFNYTFTVQ